MTNEIIFQPDFSKFNSIKDGVVDVLKSPYGLCYVLLPTAVIGYAIYKNYGITYNTKTGVLSLNTGC